METAANDLYTSGWSKLEKETFDNTAVQNAISKHFSREVTKETKEKTGQIILMPRQIKDTFKVTESKSQSAKEFVEMPNKLTDYVNKIFARDKLSGEDLREILEELTVQANRYDPYPSKSGIKTALDSCNRRTYEAINDIKKSEKKIEADDIKEIEQMADDYILSSSYKTSNKFGQEKVRSKGRYKRRK